MCVVAAEWLSALQHLTLATDIRVTGHKPHLGRTV